MTGSHALADSARRAVRFDVVFPPLPEFFRRGCCRDAVDEEQVGLWDFVVGDESQGERRRRLHAAAAICEECPVRALCANYAVSDPYALGVWGGMLMRQYGKPVDLMEERARALAAAN